MPNSQLRPETRDAAPGKYAPTGGTAYLLVLNAVQIQRGLIHGKFQRNGEYCAIGSFFEAQPNAAMNYKLIDEITTVNDSVPNATPRQRRLTVMRWLKWKLAQVGMPGYERYSAAK